MRKILLILLACLPLVLPAREKKDNSNPKYLAGAITLTDEGKITFTEELKAPTLSKEAIYKQMLAWANERFQPKDKLRSRVVFTDEAKGEIAASAEEYMVFSSSALSLDRTRIYYKFLIYAADGNCKLEMSAIRYWYDENRDGGERYTAEEWITDEMALNKKKTKLAPICGKFRRETIDLKDELFQSAAAALGTQALNTVPATPLQPATPVAATLGTGELKAITFEQLPANLNTLVASGRLTLTANDEEIELKPENWGGFGKLFSKNVTYTLVDQSRIAINAVMEHSDAYTLSLYTADSTQPAIVIQCKKAMAQPMSADDLKSLNQAADASKSYTMYIGEITGIQMR